VALVFAAHVAFIFIFGSRKPVPPAQVKNAPSLALATESAGNWVSLNEATLFALPGPDGFAAAMWTVPSLPFHVQEWTEPPRWLVLPANELGATFNHFVQTNPVTAVHFEYNLPPPLTVPAVPAQSPFAQSSALQIEGDLASRPLLNPMKLPAWPFADVIAPSVVQVLVDAAGNVVSATLLPPENFLEANTVRDADADQQAVTLARAARFAPLSAEAVSVESGQATQLAVGQMIFTWQTVPAPASTTP
jgi:hypothetical protein